MCRGCMVNTHLYKIEQFIPLKQQYDSTSADKRSNWCWVNSYSLPIAKFKNELIGVLCTELAEGKELNEACQVWNKRVDPINYMKTTAPITKKQIEEAKKFVEDKNRKGDIYFKESDFNCGREFDIKSSSSSKTSGIGLQYLDSIPQYKSFSINDLTTTINEVSKSSLKQRRGGQIPQFKISKETEEYLKLKDEAFEKELKSYSESLTSLYYNPSAEIKLEQVDPGYSTPPENLELNEKSEDNLPW